MKCIFSLNHEWTLRRRDSVVLCHTLRQPLRGKEGTVTLHCRWRPRAQWRAHLCVTPYLFSFLRNLRPRFHRDPFFHSQETSARLQDLFVIVGWWLPFPIANPNHDSKTSSTPRAGLTIFLLLPSLYPTIQFQRSSTRKTRENNASLCKLSLRRGVSIRLLIAVYYATGGPVEDGPSQAWPFLLSLLIYDVLLVTLVTCAKPQY